MSRMLVIGLLSLATLVGCRDESVNAPRLSAIGESCAKTSDCESDARCINQLCAIDPGDRASSGKQDKPQTPTPTGSPAPVVLPASTSEEKCPTSGLAGPWRFTTLVATGKEPSARGVNGNYRMDLSLDAECGLIAAIVKTGYGNVVFQPEDVQVGKTVLTSIISQEFGQAWEAPITLRRDSSPEGLRLVFFFQFSENEVRGLWHYTEDSWKDARMAGGLLGQMGEASPPRFSDFAQLSRRLSCVLHSCDSKAPKGRGFDCSELRDDCIRSDRDPSSFLERKVSPTPPPSRELPPVCEKVLSKAMACFREAGDVGKAGMNAFAETERAWRDAAASGGGPALEAGCKQAASGMKQMAAMCPRVRWD